MLVEDGLAGCGVGAPEDSEEDGMFHRYTHLVVKEHQKALEAGTRTEAMLRAAGKLRPPLRQRLMLWVGEARVSTGRRLQKRYEPALRFGAEGAKQAASRPSV
jgi:hypothetical protein